MADVTFSQRKKAAKRVGRGVWTKFKNRVKEYRGKGEGWGGGGGGLQKSCSCFETHWKTQFIFLYLHFFLLNLTDFNCEVNKMINSSNGFKQ